MNPHITRITSNDLEELRHLFSIVLHDTFRREEITLSHPDEIVEEVEAQMEVVRKDLESKGREEYLLTARISGDIVGTAAYGEPNSIIKEHAGQEGGDTILEVKSIYILPEYQRKGIGTMLFAAILEKLDQMGYEEFFLDSGYRDAQRFWQTRLGEPSIVLEKYWSGGSDHMIWRRRVRGSRR